MTRNNLSKFHNLRNKIRRNKKKTDTDSIIQFLKQVQEIAGERKCSVEFSISSYRSDKIRMMGYISATTGGVGIISTDKISISEVISELTQRLPELIEIENQKDDAQK